MKFMKKILKMFYKNIKNNPNAFLPSGMIPLSN